MANDAGDRTNPQDPTQDQLSHSSLSGLILVFSVLLFLSLLWALGDELVFQRPWKRYQERFVKVYTSYLKKLGPRQASAEKAVQTSPEFLDTVRQLKAAEDAIAPRLSELDRQLSLVRQRLAAIKDPFQDARARIAALTYEMDHTTNPKGKDSIRKDINELKKGPFRVTLPTDGGVTPVRSEAITFGELEKLFSDLKSNEARLTAEQTEATKAVRELRRKRTEYLHEHLAGLNQQQIDGLLRKMEKFSVEIKQIHVEGAGLVDRCESCHVGIREPLPLTAADIGGERAFVSHPNKALLAHFMIRPSLVAHRAITAMG